jgi:hypothetical protein
MKKSTTLLLALLLLAFASCGDSTDATEAKETSDKTGKVASPDEKQAIFKQFENLASVEIWRTVDGMNSTPIIITDAIEMKDFYNLIGTKIENKPDCKFTAGITFVKADGDMIFAELNLSDECQTINYFNTDGKMEYHTIRPEGLKLLKSTIDKIELPNK